MALISGQYWHATTMPALHHVAWKEGSRGYLGWERVVRGVEALDERLHGLG